MSCSAGTKLCHYETISNKLSEASLVGSVSLFCLKYSMSDQRLWKRCWKCPLKFGQLHLLCWNAISGKNGVKFIFEVIQPMQRLKLNASIAWHWRSMNVHNVSVQMSPDMSLPILPFLLDKFIDFCIWFDCPFQMCWNRGNNRLWKLCNTPKTLVWNIPQVHSLIGNRF